MPAEKTAVAVFAHPDDETLLAGALIAKLVRDGWSIHLICLAPGDDNDLESRMQLAAAELGIASVSSLRYSAAGQEAGEETGQADTAGSAPRPPKLASAPEQVVVDQVVGQFGALQPDMVLTHSPSGDYGHGDHAYCHRIAVAAAEAMSSAQVFAFAWPGFTAGIARFFNRRSAPELRSRRAVDEATSDSLGPDLVAETHHVGRFLGIRKRAARHYYQEIARGPIHLRMLEAVPTWLQRLALGRAHLRRIR